MKRSIHRITPFVALACAAAISIGCEKNETPKSEPSAATTTKAAPNDSAKAAKPAQDTKPAGKATLADMKGNYEVDAPHSTVVFRIKHAGISYTYGTLNNVTGKLTIDPDVSKSSMAIDVDANSFFTADKKRDDHVKGPDFLNTKQFPKMTFKSKSVAAAGEGKFKVDGDLTLHGVTKSISVTMEQVGAGVFPMDKSYRAGFEGTVDVKRSDFDMKNMMGAVGDDIRLIIAIEATRK